MTSPSPAVEPRRRAPLIGLLAGNAISILGNGLTALAVPWFVLETTGSAARTGLVAFAGMLPTVIGGLLGGSLVDRLGHKTTSIMGDLASGVTVAMIPLLHHTIGLAFWQLLVLVFFGALLDAPGGTARTAMTPRLADSAGVPLERVNAIGQTIQSGALLLGPPLAGGLIALAGPSNVLWLDAASFGVSALLIAGLVPRVTIPQSESGDGYLAELSAGVRFVFSDRLLRAIAGPSMAINFLVAPLFPVLLPVFASEAYGEAIDLGVLVAAFGAGMLAGSLAYGAVGTNWSKRRTLWVGALLTGLPFFALALTPSLPLAAITMGVIGLTIAPINPVVMTAIQRRTPEQLQGRVIGAMMAASTALAPAGMVTMGVVLGWVGVGPALVAMGIAFIVMAALLLRNPVFAELDRE